MTTEQQLRLECFKIAHNYGMKINDYRPTTIVDIATEYYNAFNQWSNLLDSEESNQTYVEPESTVENSTSGKVLWICKKDEHAPKDVSISYVNSNYIDMDKIRGHRYDKICISLGALDAVVYDNESLDDAYRRISDYLVLIGVVNDRSQVTPI